MKLGIYFSVIAGLSLALALPNAVQADNGVQVVSVTGNAWYGAGTPANKLAKGAAINANMTIKTDANARVVINMNGQQVVIPGNTTMNLGRLSSERNPAAAARVLAVAKANGATFSTSSVSAVAGVRASRVTQVTAGGNDDAMTDEDDLDARALAAIKRAQQYIETNQIDLVLNELVPFESYRGTYATTLSEMLGNILFDRAEYERALPLLKVSYQNRTDAKLRAHIQYKVITALVNTGDLVGADREVKSWLEKGRTAASDLTPFVLQYQVVISDYLQNQAAAKAAFVELNRDFPNHDLAKQLREIYPDWATK